MHRNIKRFQMESVIADDSMFIRQRELQEGIVIEQMRYAGYVPVLDLGPFWSTKLNENQTAYIALISMYGYYVGRKKAWEVMGMDGAGRYYPMSSSQKSKSSQS